MNGLSVPFVFANLSSEPVGLLAIESPLEAGFDCAENV